MREALHDQALHDVSLQGADGGAAVAATKAVLALRSPVFKRMFFGNLPKVDPTPSR